MKETEKEKVKEYGQRLNNLLSTEYNSKDNTKIKPNISYNTGLNDEEFLKLFKLKFMHFKLRLLNKLKL